jgi:hypothetical protein
MVSSPSRSRHPLPVPVPLAQSQSALRSAASSVSGKLTRIWVYRRELWPVLTTDASAMDRLFNSRDGLTDSARARAEPFHRSLRNIRIVPTDVVSALAHLLGRSGCRDRIQAAKSSTASTTRSKRME